MIRTLDRAVDAVLVLSLATIVTVLVLQVALRYLLRAPLPWPEELSQFLLVAISFFGMYRAFREGSHIRISWLPKRPLVLRLMRAGGLLCVAIFLVYIGIGGYQLSLDAWHQPSVALRLPMAIPYLLIPISSALSLIALALGARDILTGEEEPATDHQIGGAST